MKTTRYFREELKKLRLEIKLLKAKIQGMTDAIYYASPKS